jgi:hypothetical protein
VVLAAGAHRSGALPGDHPGFGVGWIACLVGMSGLVAAWWQVGAAARAGIVRMRWLLVTGALWSLPLLAAPPLASRDVYSYACQGWLYAEGVDLYSVGVSAGGCPWAESVSAIWRDTPTPYGPLAVALSGLAVRLARLATPDEHGRLLVTVGLLRLLAVLGVVLMAWAAIRLARACGMDPPAVAWLGVLGPLVAVHVVSAAHHDGLLAGLVLAGLAFAGDPRTRWGSVAAAGAALGLAAAVKVTAVVAVPFAALLVMRHARRLPAVVAFAAAAAGAFAAVSAVTGLGLGWVHALPAAGRVVQWTSVPSGVGMTAGYLLTVIGWGAKAGGGPTADGTAVAVARLAGLAVLVAVLVVGWLQAARLAGDTRAVVVRCGAVLAACVLLAPVFFPWYAVVPLAVLAASVVDQRVRWRLAAAAAVLGFLILPNGHGLASFTRLPGAIADVVLVVALGWWLAVRGRDSDRLRARRVIDATR